MNFQKKNKTYLTPEGFRKLKEEYETLVSEKYPAVAKRIQSARDMGILDDNPEYEAALNEQAFIKGRISELENLLKTAVIVEKPQDFSVVKIGSTVVVQVNDEVDEFTIVGKTEADPAKNRISNESPVGKALLGKKVGDEVVVETEVFSTRYKIIEIK